MSGYFEESVQKNRLFSLIAGGTTGNETKGKPDNERITLGDNNRSRTERILVYLYTFIPLLSIKQWFFRMMTLRFLPKYHGHVTSSEVKIIVPVQTVCLKDHFISLDLDVIIFNSDFLLRPQLHIGELTWWLNLWLREWRSFWTP